MKRIKRVLFMLLFAVLLLPLRAQAASAATRLDYTATINVDGEALDEPYIAEKTTRPIDFDGKVTVPEGCVFVMGDNRNKSTDSRDEAVGMVDVRYIIGREIIRAFPLNKFGFVD